MSAQAFRNTFDPNIGGAVLAHQGTLSVVDCTFDGSGAAIGGGAIAAIGAYASITGSTFRNNEVQIANGAASSILATHGWAVDDQPARLIVADCVFEPDLADGSVIENVSNGGSTEIQDSIFDLDAAIFGTSGVHASKQVEVVMDNLEFLGGGLSGTYSNGAIVAIDGSSAAISMTDITFDGAEIGQSLVFAWQYETFSAERIRLLGNATDAAFVLVPLATGSTTIDPILACDNAGGPDGFALLGDWVPANVEAPVDIGHLTMIDSRGPLVAEAYDAVSIHDALVLGDPEFGDHVGWTYVGTDATTSTVGVTTMSPGLGATTVDACTLALLEPDPSGPAVDVGNPESLDRDGTRSDLGALGGPDGFVFTSEDDVDEDGVGWFHDCIDTNATIHPLAAEIPYDALDQDCDGTDLCDVDADGSDAEACGGADCDDDDPARNAEATDDSADGIDQDCSGADFEPERPPLRVAGACSTTSGAGWWVAFAGAALIRRRHGAMVNRDK